MIKCPSRDIALNHFRSSLSKICEFIEKGLADDNNNEYSYHKELFERSLNYIESIDRTSNYKKDDE
jgi:hypothetical protein